MDAYDRIHEETISSPERESVPATTEQTEQSAAAAQNNDLGTEFREAYQALSTSAWGLKLGGFFEQVKKQGASYYEGAKQELSAASAEASKGWTDLISHTSTVEADASAGDGEAPRDGSSVNKTFDPSAPDAAAATTAQPATEVPESLPTDIVKEAETMLSKFRVDAAARLKQIQQAEDAADAALERFGANIKNFLRDAVTIAPPSIEDDTNVKRDVLFESKDIDGKRVVHATRFDAQLHVIHSNLSSFTQDPASPEYGTWKESFDVEKKTDTIAKDLDKYDELRRAMDALVPEQVSYPEFWTRYYFLRHVIETEEQKRRELLKGTQLEEEEIAWDDDDDDDDDEANRASTTPRISQGQEGHASTTTLTANNTTSTDSASNDLLKPNEPRRSNEQSVADSDASYDIVSGATSRSPGTPGEEKDLSDKKIAARRPSDDSDDDWE